ncbi:transient receptor potential channel pyrexia-like isoform X2 [Cherax quadricarinatus]|uniref:transient receptor potential channel pyrexia-like isoform X2 n=1 Tax=Cherax quadricarinatus TaxID=27406 RepID=UPI00387E36AE
MTGRKPLFRYVSWEDSIPGTPLSRGPKPDVRFLALLEALKTRYVQGVRDQLLQGLPVNYREPALGNKTPLICASEYGFVEAVAELLGAGANVSIADATGATPLHMAAGGGHFSTVRLLLSRGAHVDPLDTHASTPLHYAARGDKQDPGSSNMVGVVELLLSAGARCGLRDGEGRLPLHNAAHAGSAKLIRVLAAGAYKATVNLKDNEGRTPLHCAVLGARSLDAVAAMIELGSNIDSRDAQGHTSLHLAAKRQVNYVDDEFDGTCLELLLSHGASVAAKNDEGYNGLTLALRRTMWFGRPGARDHILHAVQQLVAKGSCVQDGFAMWRMVESFPSLVPVALNRSVCANTSARDSPHLRLDFDFGPLSVNAQQLREIQRQSPLNPQSELPSPLLGDSEVAMLHYILWAGRKRLLLHPLCKAYLHLKWSKIRKYFLANVIFYFLFVLSLTAFLLSSSNCPEHTNDASNTSAQITNLTTDANSKATAVCRWTALEAGVVGLTWWCLVIFSALLDLREVIQVMMTGELNYESTFLAEPSGSSVLCIFILVVFIVLVYIILSNLLVGLAVSDMYAIQQRSEVLQLTQHVELMIQVEALFKNRLIPQKMQQCLLSSIGIMGSQEKPIVSVYPNLTRGFSDTVFLFFSRVIGTRRLMIKLFEIFISGFIPPEHEVSLPSQLMREALDVALREHELDKRERLLHLRALQIGASGHHKQGQLGQPSQAQLPISQTTLTRGPSYIRPATKGARSSWRWTFMSDTDGEDDSVNMLPTAVLGQPSIWSSHPVATQRTVIPDPNARLEELRNILIHLEDKVEKISVVIQQRDTDCPPSSQTIHRADTEVAV